MLTKQLNQRKIETLISIIIIIYLIFLFAPENSSSTEKLHLSEAHTKIEIIGNSGWANAKVVGLCSGNGTFSNPYIIQDFEIDGGDSGTCIFIKDSDVYFRIENCTLYNTGGVLNLGEKYAGIRLTNVSNAELIDNIARNNLFGIRLENCNNQTISGNLCHDNDMDGIYLMSCNNSMISGNNVYNDFDGIYLHSCINSTILGNIANTNEGGGIRIWYSNIGNVSGNIANSNNYWGIQISSSKDIIVSGNLMHKCGISVSGSLKELRSYDIDLTNLVNGKPLYYYVNEINLGSYNFTNAGQVILINCRNSLIQNLNLSYASDGLQLYYCNNINISGNIICNNNHIGLYLAYSNNNFIAKNIIKNSTIYSGLYLYYSNENLILGNLLNYNHPCAIQLYSSDRNNISGNNINNNWDGIRNWDSDYTNIIGNILTGNNRNFHLIGYSFSFIYNWNLEDGKFESFIIDEFGKGDFTWNQFVDLFSWIYGSGTRSDPYIIEGLTIDGEGSGSCIQIKNSKVFFQIVNCTIINSGYNDYDAGIKLSNVSNSQILTNNCSLNKENGILLIKSSNNKILGNNVDNNFIGISFNKSYDNTITENLVNENYLGILLNECCNITIKGNLMNKCGLRISGSLYESSSHNIDVTNLVNGKILYYYANNIELKPNNFSNPGQVILANCSDSLISFLNLSNASNPPLSLYYCNNNIISENNLYNNNREGIFLYYCNNNTILGNNIDNNRAGIYLYNCNNNTISGNNLCNNYYSGIYFYNCNNNIILENIANGNHFYGLTLSNSQNNIIYRNSANNNHIGIYLASNNFGRIMRNNITNNYYGIYLYDSSYNNISYNNLFGNSICITEYSECWGNIFLENEYCDYGKPLPLNPLVLFLIFTLVFISVIATIVTISMYRKKIV
ncbi:MAG: nitrous oxide reductase family maturation protein NosD, partial [Candidatus Thorarchaeota archaeon]